MEPDNYTAVSLFAGIGGFELGMAAAGVRTVASVEKDPMARGVLRHRFPSLTLFNDVCEVTGDDLRAAGFTPERGILTAGFPCQDVSVAGKRAGLAGARTGLYWEIVRLLDETRPKWFLLENVPGLLSSNGGRDMGTVIGNLVERGYGVGWRVLDAQHFGVPQRRRRVFIAGCLGDPASAGEVLLEPESGPGNPGEGQQAGPASPGAARDRVVVTGGPRGLLADTGVVGTITKSIGGAGADAAHAQAGWLIPEQTAATFQAGRNGVRLDAEGAAGGHLIPEAQTSTILSRHSLNTEVAAGGQLIPEVAHTLTSRYQKGVNTTFDDGALVIYSKVRRAQNTEDFERWEERDVASTRNCFDNGEIRACEVILETGAWRVRRLMPIECERLQGIPDNHTAERWDEKRGKVVAQSDSARGHQIGNAVAVPVVAWIAKRIVANPY